MTNTLEKRSVVAHKAFLIAAHSLKRTALVSDSSNGNDFLQEVFFDSAKIKAAYNELVRGILSARYLDNEAEWLLENFYVVEGVLSDIQQSFKRSEIKRLPQSLNDKNVPVARIYLLVEDLLSGTDNQISAEVLRTFLRRYQKDAPLTIRELDILPVILQLALVSKMKTTIIKMTLQAKEYSYVESIISEILKEVKNSESPSYSKFISRLSSHYKILSPHLGLHIVDELTEYTSKTRPILKWLKLHFSKQGIRIGDLGEAVSQERERTLSAAAHIVDGLRWISQVRWNDFLEDVDPVEKIMSRDPSGEYPLMNEQGRGEYRRKIVRIADKTGIADIEVAKVAVRFAQNFSSAGREKNDARSHVGYYLVDDGVSLLEEEVGYTPLFLERVHRFSLENPAFVYFVPFLILLLLPYLFISQHSIFAFAASNTLFRTLFPVSVFVLLFEITLAFINMVLAMILPVKRIFSLDLHDSGAGEERSTFVVIPSMMRDEKSAKKLLSRIETAFVGNRDTNVYYALLLDFQDAPFEVMPHDDDLVRSVRRGIEELNERYSPERPVFFFYHRKRLWNPNEGLYMGWERKRGKLREFNRLLRGSKDTSYVLNNETYLPFARYIVTIDEDTEVPRESILSLVGSISHSLNRPVPDAEARTVLRGYGIIQPRACTRMESASASVFSKLFSSAVGIDSYSGLSADVYQDLFGEGVFYGKGIYDIDTVEMMMGDDIPENLVLSHDLLEGLYARTGYASDIQFFDSFPSSFVEFESRNHRWTRGDWQIIGWLWKSGKKFGLIGRWKIFDNLRRSTVSIAAVIVLGFSFSFGYSSTLFSTILVASVFGLIPLLGTCIGLFSGLNSGLGRLAIRSFFDGIFLATSRMATRMIFVLHDAYISLHAIILSLVRMRITKKRLLEWNTAYDVARKRKNTLGAFWCAMLPSFVASLVLLYIHVLVPVQNGQKVSFAGLFWVVGWMSSFLVAYLFSLPRNVRPNASAEDRTFLRKIAYRSIRYFTDFSVEKNNYLIPDHYQVDIQHSGFAPGTITSSTNLGMMLVSFLSAYRLGFFGFREFSERLGSSLETIASLERYRGHLYNWYDIHKLTPAGTRYVSSADSANFIVSIVTLRQGLLALLDGPLFDTERRKESLADSVSAIRDDANSALTVDFPKTLKKNIQAIAERAESALVFIKERKNASSFSSFLSLLRELEKYDISIREQVEKLRLQTDHAKISPIYSSSDFFSGLLFEGKRDFDSFLSFHLVAETVRTEYRHWCDDPKLSPLFQTISRVTGHPLTVNGVIKDRLGETLSRINAEAAIEQSSLGEEEKRLAKRLLSSLLSASSKVDEEATKIAEEIKRLANICEDLISGGDFSFLYNKERGLFHIGYNAAYGTIDNSYYDFLASESNLISFAASIKGQSRMRQWFNLGRRTIRLPGGEIGLSSWGGSLFEYLTSLLFLRAPKGSFFDEAGRRAIRSQMRYAVKHRTPWGMGESACGRKNAAGDYHYQIFGDPSLGFKRGLDEQIVVAPYTTVMSIPLAFDDSLRNLKYLIKDKAFGLYGFFDAVEYTGGFRNFRKSKGIVAEVYYAHHLGFIIASLLNVLDGDAIRKLFHSDPRVMSSEFLLEETFPLISPLVRSNKTVRVPKIHAHEESGKKQQKEFVPALPPIPRYAFLSNGSFSTVIDSSGGGYCSYKGQLVTRRTADSTLAPLGTYVYLKHAKTGDLWSVSHLPTASRKGGARTVFSEDAVEFYRNYGSIESTMRVQVHQHDPVEERTITLTNVGTSEDVIDVVSYGEMVLATPAEDAHHPLFHKLFVKTEADQKKGIMFFEKRSLANEHGGFFVAHAVVDHGEQTPVKIYARTREDFIGRGDSYASPSALRSDVVKTGAESDYTLDPIATLSKTVKISAGDSVTVTFLTAASEDRDTLEGIINKYKKRLSCRKIRFSERRTADPLLSFGITPYYSRIFRRLLSGIAAGEYIVREPSDVQSVSEPLVRVLWRNGISGDLPMLVIRISGIGEMSLLRSSLLFWKYAQFKGYDLDAVILNEHPTSYNRTFEDDIDIMIRNLSAEKNQSQKGRLFHLKSSLMEKNDIEIIEKLAHAVLRGEDGAIEKQVRNMPSYKPDLPKKFISSRAPEVVRKELPRPKGLFLDNGIGGFDRLKREYVMYLNKNTHTPVPWTNIIATEHFGTVVSNSGASYSWSGDSYDNRLTAWYNDPLIEKSGEAFYFRDEESGEIWSPTPFPVRGPRSYIVRHGAGYSVFEYYRQSIFSSLTMFVPKNATVKVCLFLIENRSERPRTISLTAYTEPVLGALREHSQTRLRVNRDETTGALLVQNSFRNHFSDRFMFLDNGGNNSYTTSRREFIGTCGDMGNPAALRRRSLSCTLVCGDSCAVGKREEVIEPGQTREFTVLLGEAINKEEMTSLIGKYRNVNEAKKAFGDIRGFWNDLREKMIFETPDKKLDVIINDWLPYQNLSSRVFARTGYYQPSGAFGFRDQLQDLAAFVWTDPDRFRSHIINAAAHQFLEGDALNWWHSHNNFGKRSTVTDHHLWLVWAVLRYIDATGDNAILEEEVPFLSAPVPNAIVNQWTGVPEVSREKASIYEHCARALNKSTALGVHNLPLMGGGDWNDGLNHVGSRGKGESIWLAWFILSILDGFISIAEKKKDEGRVSRFSELRNILRSAVEKHGWDGKWYKRAFLDNGAPLGSSANQEYQIDSIVQSYAVLSENADSKRAKMAMESVFGRLFADNNYMRLLEPPVDKMTVDIGYLAAYPPGVRENGAQYNHAAMWGAKAFAKIGNMEMLEKILVSVNPSARSDTGEKALVYRTEPYVVASDIYVDPSYPGRGGWTWYTGTAGVMYRTIVKYVFGMQIENEVCTIEPSMPASWPEMKMTYRYKTSVYRISVKRCGNDDHAPQLVCDGVASEKRTFKFIDDGRTHDVRVDV